MSDSIDIKLLNVRENIKGVPDTVGYFDISVASNGDLTLEDGFDTNLILSIFCERRAASYEVSTPQYRRGWWGNTTSDEGFEIGSKLWLLDQARLTTSTLNLSAQYAADGLKWLIKDGYLADVVVNAEATVEANSPRINLEVKLVRKDNTVEYKYFTVWNNTGT